MWKHYTPEKEELEHNQSTNQPTNQSTNQSESMSPIKTGHQETGRY